MITNQRIADERHMLTTPITPMELEMQQALLRCPAIHIPDIQFRQRFTSYHLRWQYWKQLAKTEFDAIRQIAERHGYECTESENGRNFSYSLKQIRFVA